MSEERYERETVSDIMSEMRGYADSMEKHLIYDLSECSTDYLRVLADRIEEAVNRQFRDVTKMIQYEEVDVSKMETTTQTSEKSSVVGNAEAMREALEQIRELLSIGGKPDTAMCIRYEAAYLIAKEALSVPPRNCDVGTEEEQVSRYNKFCMRSACNKCPFYVASELLACGVRWSQMPYEEGSGNEQR